MRWEIQLQTGPAWEKIPQNKMKLIGVRASCILMQWLWFSRGTSSPLVLGCKHKSYLWTSNPNIIFLESVVDSLSRNMIVCSLVLVLLHGSGTASSVPSCTKQEVTVLLLVCCIHMAFSMSAGVLACLLIFASCSGHCWQSKHVFLPQLTLRCHPWWALPEQLL